MKDHDPDAQIGSRCVAGILPILERICKKTRVDGRIHVSYSRSSVMERLQEPCIHREFNHRPLRATLSQILRIREVGLVRSPVPIHGMSNDPAASWNRSRIAMESQSLHHIVSSLCVPTFTMAKRRRMEVR